MKSGRLSFKALLAFLLYFAKQSTASVLPDATSLCTESSQIAQPTFTFPKIFNKADTNTDSEIAINFMKDGEPDKSKGNSGFYAPVGTDDNSNDQTLFVPDGEELPPGFELSASATLTSESETLKEASESTTTINSLPSSSTIVVNASTLSEDIIIPETKSTTFAVPSSAGTTESEPVAASSTLQTFKQDFVSSEITSTSLSLDHVDHYYENTMLISSSNDYSGEHDDIVLNNASGPAASFISLLLLFI